MTITIEKKHLYWFAGIIVSVICVVFLINIFSKPDFAKTAVDMKLNSRVIADISKNILADYGENWRTAINNSHAINTDGKSEWCSDFNQALSWRYQHYTKEGTFMLLDSLQDVVKEEMRIIDDASSKNVETKEILKELYNAMNTLVSMAQNPKGNIWTFNQMVNEAIIKYDNAYVQADVKLPVTKEQESEHLEKALAPLVAMQVKKAKEKAASDEKLKIPGKQFLAENAKKDGVVVLPSGLQYKIIKKGYGRIPKDTSMVKVNYEGRTIDGNVFDSSYKRNYPLTLRCNQTIKGWTEAMTLMPEGSVWEIYIPENLAYGEREQGDIKPFSTLIFKVQLIKIVD